MKKFLSKLFSRPMLVVLILLLQVLLIWIAWRIFFLIFEENFTTFGFIITGVIQFTCELVVFLIVLNKNGDPEFKIPWVFILMLAPILGVLLYIFFGNHGLSRKDQLIVDTTKIVCKEYGHRQPEEVKKIQKDIGERYGGYFAYLHHVTGLRSHNGNRVTCYKNGETFFPSLIEDLKQAKEFIFLEFFIISQGEQWSNIHEVLVQKAAEGVDVRIIYDDLGCAGTLPSNYFKTLKNEGIKAYRFAPFRPLLSGIYNNRDHRKIVIIDHKYGYTGGMNLADEYANIIHPYGYWKDMMVCIEGSAINNLIALFLGNWDICCKKISDYNTYLNYQYPRFKDSGYIFPFGDGAGSYDNGYQAGEQNYINVINSAKESLFISTPYLVPTYTLLAALKNAALRGVDVNLFLPYIPDKKVMNWMGKCHFPELLDVGVKIYLYKPGFNHEKCMLSDDKLAFVGTINLDFRSLVHHFECGVLLYNVPCIKEIRDDFNEMMEKSVSVPAEYKISRFKRLVCAFIKLFAPLL